MFVYMSTYEYTHKITKKNPTCNIVHSKLRDILYYKLTFSDMAA